MAPAQADAGDGASRSSSSTANSCIVHYGQTDFPVDARQPVLEAVRLLHRKFVIEGKAVSSSSAKRKDQPGKVERWEEFARAMQASLENSGGLGSGWSVVIGETVGFACKKRKQRVATFRLEGVLILIWRSPGIETIEPALPAASTAADADAAAVASRGPLKLRVLEPEGDTVESNSVVATIQSALGSMAAADFEDVQKVAQTIRGRLTDEHGTIWHVLVGKRLLVVRPPADAKLHVRISVDMKVPLRIECYKHEQFEQYAVDFEKLFKAAPYFLLMVFCFAYMTFYSVCQEELQLTDGVKMWLKKKICKDGWESNLNSVGVASLAAFFVSKKSHLLFKNKGA